MSSSPRTTVISVCYNSLAVLPTMLDSLPRGTPVVLVDNASADHAALAQLAAERRVHLVRSEVNRGFGVGCNRGAQEVTTEFLLFINPDAALQPGALEALEAAMDRYPQASALNPRLMDGDGKPYFKHRSVLLARSAWMKRGWPDRDCVVPVLSGAALFVRRDAFAAVGGFDPAIFLYHEDDDLSLRLARECGPLMFIRDAEVRHLEGHSTVRSPQSAAFKAFHMGQSRVYAARKHKIGGRAMFPLLAATLQLLSPVTLLSSRQRAKRWAFLKGMLSVVRQNGS